MMKIVLAPDHPARVRTQDRAKTAGGRGLVYLHTVVLPDSVGWALISRHQFETPGKRSVTMCDMTWIEWDNVTNAPKLRKETENVQLREP